MPKGRSSDRSRRPGGAVSRRAAHRGAAGAEFVEICPQFRRPEDLELIVGPQLLVAIPDFSLAFTDPMWKRLIPSLTSGKNNGSEVATQEVAVAETGAPKVVTESRERFDRSFVTHWLPGSFAAEQYRVAATRLTLLGSRNRSQVIPITSAIKGEGKTTTTINLGYTMARDLGKHTLLIDCDFQHPNLHTFIKFAPLRGIADCLMGHVRLDDCMVRFTGLPCWIMPVGSSTVSTTEILRTEKLVGILDQLRERFEYIFINAPPVLPQATMNILTRHADLLIFVIRADSTPKPVAMRGMSSLPTTVPIHVILNGAKRVSLPSYGMGDNVYMQAGQGQPEARL
jgi:Mrp family chromosome partitioning ATPase